MFAYWGKFTPSGQKLWSKPVDKTFTALLKPFLKGEYLKEGVKQGNTFMSIIAGGMLTIPPLLVLENKKVRKSIAKSIDGIIYGKEKVEHDPKFQQAYDEIDQEPKKDFWTGMTSRFAALAPLLALVLIPKTKDILQKNLFRHVGNASKVMVSKAGLPAEKMFSKFPAAEIEKRWNYVHDDAVAMDLSFGLPYAGLHAFFYNMFAKDKARKHDTGTEQGDQLPAPVEAAVNSNEPAQTFSHADRIATGKSAVASRTRFTDYAQKPADSELQVSP